MYNYFKKTLPKLKTEKEKEIAKKERKTAMKLNHNIKELVSVINDYSVYKLFEPLNNILICTPGIDAYYKCWKRAIDNGSIDQEKSIYRRKIYHLLKNSGYDDCYVEDNIERFTEILISFYTSPQDILNYLELSGEITNKKKVKKRHTDK